MEKVLDIVWDWLIPIAFIVCVGWCIWHTPAFLLDFIPPENQSLFNQMSELHSRKDVIPWAGGLFGGYTDIFDWVAIIMIPILFGLGIRNIKVEPMEYQEWRQVDRVALFFGRVTMVLIISMTLVMLYEVFLRYALERPTLWANELTLWIAGFVFLLSGLYAMQQRCHIRIFLLYDMVPRWTQRTFDTIWVLLIAVFTFFLIYGSFHQVFVIKFYKWEMFGTAFDPPIPATVQPAILIIMTLIAIQAILNLLSDWNKQPVVHTATDEIDMDEIETIKRSLETK
ncbi:MAG: TRAP transporter small permease [Rhodobacteraceae bacterium]|nr:TRAP transporter small permease [Paracoccaceae bacterium]MCY4251223.1 TRAP transporter small permease [Paracoccaceae bacterium]